MLASAANNKTKTRVLLEHNVQKGQTNILEEMEIHEQSWNLCFNKQS